MGDIRTISNIRITNQYYKGKTEIIYYENSTKVINSYLLSNEEIKEIANQIEYSRNDKFDWRCVHIRTEESYMHEIKALSKLHKLGLYKSNAIDLEEDINTIKAFIYWIIGR